MKLEYPIKYAVIPMIEQEGWLQNMHDLEPGYRPACYIVSKVYLVSETTDYQKDGTTETTYKVVCPFKKDEYGNLANNVPEYSVIYDKCINSITTDKLYDSLEEALEVKNIKNDDILTDIVTQRYLFDQDGQRELSKNEFKTKLAFFNMFEAVIEKQTQDLAVTPNKKAKHNCGLIDEEELDRIVKEAVKNEGVAQTQNSVYLDENGELKTTGPRLVKKKKD